MRRDWKGPDSSSPFPILRPAKVTRVGHGLGSRGGASLGDTTGTSSGGTTTLLCFDLRTKASSSLTAFGNSSGKSP